MRESGRGREREGEGIHPPVSMLHLPTVAKRMTAVDSTAIADTEALPALFLARARDPSAPLLLVNMSPSHHITSHRDRIEIGRHNRAYSNSYSLVREIVFLHVFPAVPKPARCNKDSTMVTAIPIFVRIIQNIIAIANRSLIFLLDIFLLAFT